MNFREETYEENSKLPRGEIEQFTLFPVQNKPVELTFTNEQISSDSGLLLIKALDRKTGLIKDLGGAIKSNRDRRYLTHSDEDLIGQRIFQIMAGYEDGNDANTLRHDPILKMCLDRCPLTGPSLGSQPTISSRLENRISRTDAYRMAQC